LKHDINMEKKFENKGKAWPNTKKEKPTQPDWKGKGNFNGVEFDISMWYNEPRNESETGSFSIQFQEPYAKKESAPTSFSPKVYATNEANKMFRRDIEQEYENDNDDIFR
jgi:hypothetical protein